MGSVTMPSPPPPTPPVIPSSTTLHFAYFCVMGTKHPVQHQLAVWQDMQYREPFSIVHKDAVRYTNGTCLYIPVDYVTVLKMEMATPEELGLPEDLLAYLKLTGQL